MSERSASPFSRAGVLAIVVVGFSVFIAILYFLSVGDIGPQNSNNGRAHAAGKGLNGYSALVELVEADGFEVTQSRKTSDLETSSLLVLTPPHRMDPAELTQIIEQREFTGPTLVILPKWGAVPSSFLVQAEKPEEVQEGWVILGGLNAPRWADEASGPLALGLAPGGTAQPEQPQISNEQTELAKQRFATRGQIRGITGELPSGFGFAAQPKEPHIPLVLDQAGRTIALALRDDTGDYVAAANDEERDEIELSDSNWVVFVIEPDLMNNWGLADRDRAKAALSIVRIMGDGYVDRVVFDLTLNGFGGTVNLLTLVFQPPFLAATICLILAVLIIAWRAFLRFGPAAARARETAFGKARLVTNGADLIVRAGRLQLLAEPYIALSARRIGRSLGLAKPEPTAIDEALAARQPGKPSFTARAEELRVASKPAEILRAARALNEDKH